jgi:nucleoside-diphosphate kinase
VSPSKPKQRKGAELFLDRTLIVVKPDGVARSILGEIISRFERKGFKVIALKMVRFDKSLAQDFYSPHVGKPFYSELENFITSGNAVAAILEGNDAVDVVRRMIGVTKSTEAASGTIRGDYGLGYTDNVIHASDSKESFERESGILFPAAS